jgi:hypothetical protein
MSLNSGINAGNNNPALQNEAVVEEVEYVDDGDDETVEEVVEYVTDEEEGNEEGGNAEGESEAQGSIVEVTEPSPAASPARTPAKPKTPGKVKPSTEVKNMDMRSPQTAPAPKPRGVTLNPNSNPFPSFGNWTPETLSEIEISFPILTGKNETTNELTRSTKPEARYWKAPVVFKFGNFVSETIRINNVHSPFHTGKGYGSSYVYLCLPGFLGTAFAEAGKRRAPTKVVENSLVPDSQRWWKIANNVENSFGVITNSKFVSKSLETIFDATNNGISCSVILNFKCKAATTEKEPLRPTSIRTVSVEVVRAFINEMDLSVQMPTRVNREKPKKAPVANSGDVASDSLMKRLSELGL